MEQVLENFVFSGNIAESCTFSLKGNVVSCHDSIDLPMPEYKSGKCFTFKAALVSDVWKLSTAVLIDWVVTVSGEIFRNAKRVLRRAVAGVRHFVCSNQRGMRRVAPLVPMALRL